MQTYIALLRGINVGGKHILPMKQLLAMFSEAKCVNVCNYIQSGNIIFSAPPQVVKGLTAFLEKRIRERFGFPLPLSFAVVMNSLRQYATTRF